MDSKFFLSLLAASFGLLDVWSLLCRLAEAFWTVLLHARGVEPQRAKMMRVLWMADERFADVAFGTWQVPLLTETFAKFCGEAKGS